MYMIIADWQIMDKMHIFEIKTRLSAMIVFRKEQCMLKVFQ